MTQQVADPTMTFEDFWKVYKLDMEQRLRKTTMKQKIGNAAMGWSKTNR